MERQMLQEYGPLMGGASLKKALGFRSAAAFSRAMRLKQLDLALFPITGRRGLFCLTEDVATWLKQRRANAASSRAGGDR